MSLVVAKMTFDTCRVATPVHRLRGFDALPPSSDRPYALVARLSLPRAAGEGTDPFAAAKVSVSAFGVKCVLPGRDVLKLTLPAKWRAAPASKPGAP